MSFRKIALSSVKLHYWPNENLETDWFEYEYILLAWPIKTSEDIMDLLFGQI